MNEQCDVAIVGCGPVGQTLAILLGQRGWRVVVVERWPSPYPLPRAVHFDHEIGRILQAAGVAGAVRARSEAAGVCEWRNAAGETLVSFGRGAADGLSGWPESSVIHQPDLERILEARALSLERVAIRRGFEVFAVEPGAERVRVRARGATGALLEIDARYAVGCDGAHSFVRRAMRVPVEDLGLEFDWLVVDLRLRRPHRFARENWQLCDPARPTTVTSGGPGRRRFEFMRLPHESLEALNDERMAWALLEPWRFSPENAHLERHAVYTFRARWAETWRAGRLLLAGDAAHLLPPFVAQGLGSGLRDAATLSWQLDLVLSGRAAESLLDTYGRERIPHVRALVELSLALGRLFCVRHPGEAAARDAQLSALARASRRALLLAPPAMGQGTMQPGDPHAGELFVQGRVRASLDGEERLGLFDDVVGAGFALVGADGDPAAALTPGQRAFFASLGGRSAHVGAADAPVADLDGRYAQFFERTGRRVVLQRPDFHLFGTGKGPEDARALVAELARQLASPAVPADAGE